MNEYLPIVLQTFVIILAIIVAVKQGEKRMSTVETKVDYLEEAVKPIPGISRAVAKLEGRISDE